MARIRYHVSPRDAPPAIAARALGMTAEAFIAALPALLVRGFPPADPTTGNFDLKAIDQWQDARHAPVPKNSRHKPTPHALVSKWDDRSPERSADQDEHDLLIEAMLATERLNPRKKGARNTWGHRIEITDPAVRARYEAAGFDFYKDGEWEALVRASPMRKRETAALGGYYHAQAEPIEVKGAGPQINQRLLARGYIEVVEHRGESRMPLYRITPAGEAEWRRLMGDK